MRMRHSSLPSRRRLLEDLSRGRSLPGWWYTDPDLLEREMAAIFRRTWQYLGPVRSLGQVGDYLTGEVGGIPVLAVRNDRGIQGFVNVCRHRRHPVMAGAGHAPFLRCPYHAWTYDLAGRLRAAPGTQAEPELDLEELPLLPIRTERLGPWLFANADPGAAPPAATHGRLLQAIAEAGVDPDRLERYRLEAWHAPANWKTLLENYLECYHCPVAHPGFSAVVDVDRDRYELSGRGRVLSQVAPVRPGAGSGKAGPYDARGPVTQAHFHLAWPNLTVNINPGWPNLSLDVWLPEGPGASRGLTEHYFPPDVDPVWADAVVQFDRQVGLEDDRLTEAVQRGLAAGRPETGRLLLGRERLVLQFQRWVVEAVAGGDEGAEEPRPGP
jgi:choline monooxygenase